MHSKGFVLIAQNSEYDYVQQACALAMSIQATNEAKICLITNDKVPSRYEKLFDIILISVSKTRMCPKIFLSLIFTENRFEVPLKKDKNSS